MVSYKRRLEMAEYLITLPARFSSRIEAADVPLHVVADRQSEIIEDIKNGDYDNHSSTSSPEGEIYKAFWKALNI